MFISEQPNHSDYDAVKTIRAARAAGAALPVSGPDARLQRLCAEMDHLEATSSQCMGSVHGDDCLPYLEKLADRVTQIEKTMLKIPCVSDAGRRALAKSILVFGTRYLHDGEANPDMFSPELVEHLLRSLVE